MAREVLDVQHYPDLRQYPGGPPERPYDAAGWTLPLQMGVTRRRGGDAADRRRAREDEAASAPMPESKVKPTPYDAALKTDAAPFDSVPGAGFNTDPAAAAIVPAAGRITGTGDDARRRSGAEQRVPRAEPRVEAGRDRSDERRGTGSPIRYAHSRTPDGRAGRSGASRSRCRPSARRPRLAARCSKPRIGLYQPWTGSMDEGWSRWVLEQYGFPLVALHPEDFKSPLADRSTSSSSPTMPACRWRERQAGVAAGAAAAATVRPEYALSADRRRISQAFEQFVRGGGTSSA